MWPFTVFPSASKAGARMECNLERAGEGYLRPPFQIAFSSPLSFHKNILFQNKGGIGGAGRALFFNIFFQQHLLLNWSEEKGAGFN